MSASPPELELVDPVADAHLELAVGARLVVRLTENPTTGYRWQYTLAGQGGVECLQDEYAPRGHLRGSGGCRSITFRALRVGSTAIQFSLQRAWEAKSPLKSLRVLVEVAGC